MTVPVLVAKPFVLDDFCLTASPTTNYGTKPFYISIVNPGHPTAAGLSGNIILRNSVTTVSWGIAPPVATVVANAGEATIWNISPGDPLADNTPAPACRLVPPHRQHARRLHHQRLDSFSTPPSPTPPPTATTAANTRSRPRLKGPCSQLEQCGPGEPVADDRPRHDGRASPRLRTHRLRVPDSVTDRVL